MATGLAKPKTGPYRARLVTVEESTNLRIPHYPWNKDSSLRICITKGFLLILVRIAKKNRFQHTNLHKCGFPKLWGGVENPHPLTGRSKKFSVRGLYIKK